MPSFLAPVAWDMMVQCVITDQVLCYLLNQIIVERAARSRAPDLDKKKYLVPSDLTGKTDEMSVFLTIINSLPTHDLVLTLFPSLSSFSLPSLFSPLFCHSSSSFEMKV